jgi:hypothetical protein
MLEKWTGTKWGQEELSVTMEPETSPAVVREEGKEHTNQEQWIYYRSSNDDLWLQKWSVTKWDSSDLGVLMG